MNKLDFLRQLDKELQVLDKEERRELLAFYDERFYTGTIYEGKTEEEVIAELEHPRVIARNILDEYGAGHKYVKTKEERYTNISWGQVALLVAFDLLVVSWLIPTLFSVFVSIFGTSFTWIGTWSLLLGERTVVDQYMFLFVTSGYVLLFLFGLVVFDAFLWTCKKTIIWHLNVFKIKKRDKFIKRFSHISVESWFKKRKGVRMVKNLLIVGAIVGGVISGLWIFTNYGTVEAQYGNGEITTDTYTEDFTAEILAGDAWEIDAGFGDLDVDVYLVESDHFEVVHSYYQDDEFTIDFDYDNNTLVIRNKAIEPRIIWKFEDIFSLIGNDTELIIKVPEGLVVKDLLVDTTNGHIDVTNITAGQISLLSTNGTLDVKHVVVTSDLLMQTSNGAINVLDAVSTGFAGYLLGDTSNGKIDVKDVSFYKYNFDSSNGRIELDNLNLINKDGGEIRVDTSNGAIVMHEVYVDVINIDTSNGPITFDNEDTDFRPTTYNRHTTNGSITTNVREN